MNKILLLSVFLSFNVLASETQFGRIVDLKGEGFISYKGKTHEIRKGDVIESGSEIVIEHSGQVSFTDNSDHRFHLGNATSALVTSTNVELRSGDMWFQSLNKNDTYKIKTANALVDYQGGEAIITYDASKGKTQLMVINGMMRLANLQASELNLSVGEGHFSFIDNSYEEGAPRDPTPVGEKTYGQLVALFKNIAPMDKNSEKLFKENKREIASVHEKNSEHKDHGAREKKETKKEKQADLEKYKDELLDKHPATKKITKTEPKNETGRTKLTSTKLVIQIFGQSEAPAAVVMKNSEQTEVSKMRAPASVLEQAVPTDSVKSDESHSPEAKPYSKDYKQYKESDKLIEELKKMQAI